MQRVYKDLDFVTVKKDAARFNALLVEAGYEADEQFNTLHGAQRLLHYDRVNGKQLDTFVDSFAMCHTLDLSKRLPTDGDTLTPADLLLTKLQIVEVNDKDLLDSIALLLFHPISESEPHTIRLDELRPILRSDWGWYTTITDNLAKVADRLAGSRSCRESEKSCRRTHHRARHRHPAFPQDHEMDLEIESGQEDALVRPTRGNMTRRA